MKKVRGDRQIQCEVLVALAACRNHRKWFAGFARPYLGHCPIEIGRLVRKQPSVGRTMMFYDRLVVPAVRFGERLIRRPPFGQSVVAVARVGQRPPAGRPTPRRRSTRI